MELTDNDFKANNLITHKKVNENILIMNEIIDILSREIKKEPSVTGKCNTWNMKNLLDGLNNRMDMMKESVNLKIKDPS